MNDDENVIDGTYANGEESIADGMQVNGIENVPPVIFEEKKAVCQFSDEIPKAFFTKVIYGNGSRAFATIKVVLFLILVIEAVLMLIVDKITMRTTGWTVLGLLLFIIAVDYLVLPIVRKNNYKKISATGENRISYIFYDDSVRIKTPTIEMNLQYSEAEYYSEDKGRLAIVFPLNRMLLIDETKRTEQEIEFFKSIVPTDRQREKEKKSRGKGIIRTVFTLMYVIALALFIFLMRRTYIDNTVYAGTTYESFEACVREGNIKDVVIIEGKYVEYTFVGRGKDERYYTVYEGEIEDLTRILDITDTNWAYD